jgi:hypothetical protein
MTPEGQERIGPRYRRVDDFSSHGRRKMKIDLSEKTAIVTGSTGG